MDKDEIQNQLRQLAHHCRVHAKTSDGLPPTNGNMRPQRAYWEDWARGINEIANGLAMTSFG